MKQVGSLAEGITEKVDVLMISGNTTDETFPSRQFYIGGFTPLYTLDQNCNGMLFLYMSESMFRLS